MDREFLEFFKTHPTFISRLIFDASMKAEILRNSKMGLYVPIVASKLELWASKHNRAFFLDTLYVVVDLRKLTLNKTEVADDVFLILGP